MEREITEPVAECTLDGAVDRRAVGWSRRPLHVCNLHGHWPRKKRWEYWGVATRDHILQITIADLDYAGLATVTILDYATRALVERAVIVPLGGFAMPESVRGGDVVVDAFGLRVAIREEGDVTRLVARFRKGGRDVRVDVAVDRPPHHESISLLVPWSDRRFQYTSKHVALRARGHASVGGRVFRFGPENDAFATLDFGRGVWPYRSAWSWAAASGAMDGRVVGLNLGGQWTDGTGVTESGFVVDGRAHKIGAMLAFDHDRADLARPWRITGDGVSLDYAPFFARTVKMQLGAVASRLDWTLGRFRGELVADDGERVAVRDLLGWAEAHRARW